jgi:hypothetical protein
VKVEGTRFNLTGKGIRPTRRTGQVDYPVISLKEPSRNVPTRKAERAGNGMGFIFRGGVGHGALLSNVWYLAKK